MNDYYTKDTIDAKLDSIHETAKRIEFQTTLTNGRVTKIEDDFKKWKYIVVGGLGVASLMGAPSLFTVVKTFVGV